ncbi:MAG: hypothetical protein MJZ61_03215 [Bacteroidales bacterium]|nr:hypothetical protein [Bacteroidales bacterium]
MKRLLLLPLLLISLKVFSQDFEPISVILIDNDGEFTNVRNAPSGAIVDKIPTSHTVDFVVDKVENGWFRIAGGVYYDYDIQEDSTLLKKSVTGHWVHSSTIGFYTRNYGGTKMNFYTAPSLKSKVAFTINEESAVHPLEFRNGWVKVKCKGKIGWIQLESLCSNPLTNCC